MLPIGLPLNCLCYADDLILISRSASGLQKHIDIVLLEYTDKRLLKILIFQKQNRKTTQGNFSFFLNGRQIFNTPEYTVPGNSQFKSELRNFQKEIG